MIRRIELPTGIFNGDMAVKAKLLQRGQRLRLFGKMEWESCRHTISPWDQLRKASSRGDMIIGNNMLI